jgi:hypothetical protein
MIAIEGKVWRGMQRDGMGPYSNALAWPVMRDMIDGCWLSTIFIY